MPATAITLQTIGRGGIEPAVEVAPDTSNGNTFPNNGAAWIEVTNGSGSSANVTVDYANTVDGQTVPAKTYAVANTKKRRIGPFPVSLFGANPVVHCPASVTIAAFQLSGA